MRRPPPTPLELLRFLVAGTSKCRTPEPHLHWPDLTAHDWVLYSELLKARGWISAISRPPALWLLKNAARRVIDEERQAELDAAMAAVEAQARELRLSAATVRQERWEDVVIVWLCLEVERLQAVVDDLGDAARGRPETLSPGGMSSGHDVEAP